jgi:hypothetical protein
VSASPARRPMTDLVTDDGRRYRDTIGRYWPASSQCQHCDGENSDWVRADRLRGLVCPTCDSALDEMFGES